MKIIKYKRKYIQPSTTLNYNEFHKTIESFI